MSGIETLIKRADDALYEAKRSGRDRVAIASGSIGRRGLCRGIGREVHDWIAILHPLYGRERQIWRFQPERGAEMISFAQTPRQSGSNLPGWPATFVPVLLCGWSAHIGRWSSACGPERTAHHGLDVQRIVAALATVNACNVGRAMHSAVAKEPYDIPPARDRCFGSRGDDPPSQSVPGSPIDYASAVLSCPSGIVITDPCRAGNPIVFVNQAFTELTGYSSVEALGRNCRFLQGPSSDRRVISELRDALARGRPIRREILNYRKDGTSSGRSRDQPDL